MSLVEIVKGLDDTGNVETTDAVVKWALHVQSTPQVTLDKVWSKRHKILGAKQVTSKIGISQQIHKLVILERAMESQNERGFHNAENVLLIHDMTLLAILYNAMFLNALERIGTVLDSFHFDQFDETETAGAKGLDDGQITKFGRDKSITGLAHWSRVSLFFVFFLALIGHTTDQCNES